MDPADKLPDRCDPVILFLRQLGTLHFRVNFHASEFQDHKDLLILRKTRLPQIFNILKGDMSLVGPRPERPEIAALYSERIPEFDYRLKVKAGLTGYAQVYGKYNTTPYDKLKLDLTYIETYSLKLDLKLLMLTFKILFQKENTEGVEAWQKTAGQEKNEEND